MTDKERIQIQREFMEDIRDLVARFVPQLPEEFVLKFRELDMERALKYKPSKK